MDKDTLLFVHGWATDSWVFEDLAAKLSGGRDFINVSLPGHGGKERWDEPTITPAVKEVYGHIKKLKSKAVGIGWSLGAQALIASAAQFKGRFKALILVGATPCFTSKDDFPFGQSKALVKRMIMDMKKDPAGTLKRFYGLNFTEEELKTEGAKKFLERYKYPGPVVCETDVPGCSPIFRYDEMTTALEALYNTDLRQYLGLMDMPVLVIHGSSDSVCPVEAGRSLASSIKDALIEVFEGAGHAPFVTAPDRFLSTVHRFIEAL